MKVAVLEGGRSLERQVSLQSGGRVEEAVRSLGHECHSVDVGRNLVSELLRIKPDVAFVALHGEDGENGSLQELLQLLGIPYTGSGPGACERCWDKVATKRILRAAGIPTPDSISISASAIKAFGAGAALPKVGEQIGFPLVVKPACQGSALGLKTVESSAELTPALMAALSYSDRVVLERFVNGRDLSVSILGEQVLPTVEVHPRDHDPYSARYTVGQSSFTCPAELDQETSQQVQALSKQAFDALGCEGFARVDLLLDRDSGELTVLEVDAVPGLTQTSYLPVAAEAAGISFAALIERLLELALRK